MGQSASKNIELHYLLARVDLPQRTRLKSFIANIFAHERRAAAEIHIIFCGNHKIRALNKHYLRHNYPTDILTFELSSPGEPARADIFISIPQVRINARRFCSSLKRELHRVIIHGVLHLCGYQDKTPSERRRMRAKEDDYLEQYFNSSIAHKKFHVEH